MYDIEVDARYISFYLMNKCWNGNVVKNCVALTAGILKERNPQWPTNYAILCELLLILIGLTGA